MNDLPTRPICVLIAAIGGEGGGGIDRLGSEGGRLLLKWIIAAAAARGFPAQSTLMPGTSQRTASTSYYVELFPAEQSALDGRWPAFRTSPRPGDVDLIAAYELLEGARILQSGFASPELTTFVSSTHRAYSIFEKLSTQDGRFDGGRAIEAADICCKGSVLFDMAPVVRKSGGSQNAAMLGAIAATDVLPISRSEFAGAIESVGFDVDNNLAAFELAFDLAGKTTGETPETKAAIKARPAVPPLADIEKRYPESAMPIVQEGFRRTADFHSRAYARLYLERLDAVLKLDQAGRGTEDNFELTRETGRYLATSMAYEDVIRVADLKIRRERFTRVRKEAGAERGEIVRITDYLKPGLDELCSILTPWIARAILAAADKRGWGERFNFGLRIRSTNVSGFMLLRLMSWARILRRRGYRYREEQRLIEEWLDAIGRAERINHAFALEVVACAGLTKGYSDTRQRTAAHYRSIFDDVIAPALNGKIEPRTAAAQIRLAREAASAHTEGDGFREAMKGIVGGYQASIATANAAVQTMNVRGS